MSSSSSDAEAENEEPLLKYSRLENSITKIVKEDSVSAFAICKDHIVLGSHNGLLYILDLYGNETNRLKLHSATVNDLSIDADGLHVASASIDGRVAIHNIQTRDTQVYDYKRPVKSVAIDPNYSRNTSRRFVSGGMAAKLIMNDKGWMGNRESVLSSNEGPIMEIAWKDDLVAWANDRGVRVYSVSTGHMVGLVARRAESPRPDIYKCRLLWQDSETLIIGWVDFVTKVVVREGVGRVLALDTLFTMKLDCVVSGLATFGLDLLVMAYDAELSDLQNLENHTRKPATRPEIRVINSKFEEVSGDALGVRGFERLQPNDYIVRTHPWEKSFFIISPKDIVAAKERDAQDHISWLIDSKLYEEALRAISLEKGLPEELSFGRVGRTFIDSLIRQGEFNKAGALMPEVLREDVETWEKYVFLFAEKGHLQEITPYIPLNNPTLSSVVYEMILGHYLNNDRPTLLRTVQSWPNDIYSADDIIVAVEIKLREEKDDTLLMDCLANLYLQTDRPREALVYYLRIGSPETFPLIQKFHLFDAVQDSVLQLVQLGVDTRSQDPSPFSLVNEEAVQLLVLHSHSIPVEKVLKQLDGRPALLYCYLRALSDHDHHLAAKHSNLQVELYAEYDREKLLEFLKTTTGYSLELASQTCEKRNYIPELVYILGRTGNNKKALRLIIEKLGDVQQAIDFAKTQNDHDLWEDLIEYSLDKPLFIRGLLENASSEVDLVKLIKRIPKGLEIQGLKDSLVKIFSDYDLQMSLSQSGSNIHKREIQLLATTLRQGEKRGISFVPTQFLKHQGHENPTDVFAFFDKSLVSRSAVSEIATTSDPRKMTSQKHGVFEKVADATVIKTKLLEYTRGSC